MASRRDQTRTDDSVVSLTESMKSLAARGLRYAGDTTGFTFLDETFLKSSGPEQILSRMLSTKSYISTQSTLAGEYQYAHDHPELRRFREIGKGQTGTIWSLTGTIEIIKIPNLGRSDQLYNDHQKHVLIRDSFQRCSLTLRSSINIPENKGWLGPTHDQFWNRNIQFFPDGFERSYGLMAERIFPLPFPVRAAIVDAFAPKDVKRNKTEFLALAANKDCLVRLYLGRRSTRSGTFKLRNFDMTVNEMEYLRLDTAVYAESMAESLAILHWKAGVDANDVEFVLGSSPRVKMSPSVSDIQNASKEEAAALGQAYDFEHRSVGMWLLDFDQCQSFSWDKQGVQQLMKGFYFNDPYYPRPSSKSEKDQMLWVRFKERYLEVSQIITPDSEMPEQFINAVEAEGKRRSQAGSMFG
jgi:hypothetical protein